MVRLSFAFGAKTFLKMAYIEVPVEIQITVSLEKTAVLYLFDQKAFHIEPIKDYIKSNIEASIRKTAHQYRLIAIADNNNIADELIKSFRSKFNW